MKLCCYNKENVLCTLYAFLGNLLALTFLSAPNVGGLDL